MQHDIDLKKLNFDLLTPRVNGGSWGKIFAAMLQDFVIPINLIYNITIFYKKLNWGRRSVCKLFATMLLHL